MLQIAFVVLAFAALIAVVFGQKTAQAFVRLMVGVAFLLGAAFIGLLLKLDQIGRDKEPAQMAVPSSEVPLTFGIQPQFASEATCANLGITFTGTSLFVAGVVSGSGADRAGLIPGSVIVEVDGRIPDSMLLTAVKARHKLGDWVPFKVVSPDGRWWSYFIQLGPDLPN